MLVKLYKVINSQVYKRHETPNRPDIICQVYRCSEGITYDDRNEICHKCSLVNEPLERLYDPYFLSDWDTKFCYVYDNKKSSNNRR